MPIYEYECESCQKVHEITQKFADAPLTQCPDCNSSVRKLISRSSFALKGSGWYTTDYKRAPQPVAAGSKSAESVAAAAPEPSAAVAKSEASKGEAPKVSSEKPAPTP